MQNVKLNDRTLWFDGDSTVDADTIIDCIVHNKDVHSLFVEELTEDIVQYNRLVSKTEKIAIKQSVADFSFEWNIPEKYKQLDVIEYVSDKLFKEASHEPDFDQRQKRCAAELSRYKSLKLFGTLQTLIYIINTLTEKKIVWGVGRGSSVSSYVLFLIGVHDVDSFNYGLSINEFLRHQTD